MKRGAPLSRKTPLKRGRGMRRKVARRLSRPGPGRNEAYLMWARSLECLCRGNLEWRDNYEGWEFGKTPPCVGNIHAQHAGRKSVDSTAVPLCMKHHGDWHGLTGPFRDCEKYGLRAWAEWAIGQTRAKWAALTPAERQRWVEAAARKEAA